MGNDSGRPPSLPLPFSLSSNSPQSCSVRQPPLHFISAQENQQLFIILFFLSLTRLLSPQHSGLWPLCQLLWPLPGGKDASWFWGVYSPCFISLTPFPEVIGALPPPPRDHLNRISTVSQTAVSTKGCVQHCFPSSPPSVRFCFRFISRQRWWMCGK